MSGHTDDAGSAPLVRHAEPVAQAPEGCQMISNHIADQPMRDEPYKSSTACLTLITTTTEARVDSRLLAQHLHNKHQSLFELIKNHRSDFEELGLLRFQTGEVSGGRPEKFAMLNEDQCTLALSYSKNTPRVRQLKVQLVKAFGEHRRAASMRQSEYLPGHNQLKDVIHIKAAGSSNERHVHMNVAKLLNKTVGLEAGQRASAPVPQLALMIVAQMMAATAMQGAHDHHDGYQRVKQSMLTLSECTKLQVGHG